MKANDELLLIDTEGLVDELLTAPAEICRTGVPAKNRNDQGSHKFLWVIRSKDVPYAEEAGPLASSVSRGYLSHTNLTGGADAHCGGELWFRDPSSVWITGGSSRYPPRAEEELEAVAAGFVAAGFAVSSCGWDSETASPARFFRGNEKWRAA